MGNSPVSNKRITIHHSVSDLRLIRAALRFGQVNPRRPFTFDQDLDATILIRRINAELATKPELAQIEERELLDG